MKLLFATLAALVVLAASLRRSTEPVEAQPIAFDHSVHAEEGLTCLECHTGADKGPYARLPAIQSCMLCHEEPQGEDPEELKVAAYAEDPGWIPWREVNRYAGHVYFSHEAHVRFAEMDCAECHGDVAALEEPLTESQLGPLTMTWCMDCHAERDVSNDCILCHK